MKTKFVLHGGFHSGKKQQNDGFFQEILKDTPDTTKILLVYFAEEDEKVLQRIEQDSEEFIVNRGFKKLQFRVSQEVSFVEDCQWADVVYLHGGKTIKILGSLSKYPNIRQILSGKTIAGDSAGVNVLARQYYSKTSKMIGTGLGVLPFKIVVHYEDDMQNPLADIEPHVDTIFLREYEVKVIEI